MARKKRTAFQRFNEAVTGTNYCGPFTSTNKRPNSGLDELCQQHDDSYKENLDYVQWNEGDEKFLSGMENMPPLEIPQQERTRLAAIWLFKGKKRVSSALGINKRSQPMDEVKTPQDYLNEGIKREPSVSNRKPPVNAKMPRRRNYVAKRKRRSSSRRFVKRRSYPVRRRTRTKRPSTFRKRTSRYRRKPKVTTALVKAIRSKTLMMNPPVIIETNSSFSLAHGNNSDSYHEFTIMRYNDSGTDDTVQTRLFGESDNYVKFKYNTYFDLRFQNSGNTTFSMEIFRVNYRKRHGNTSLQSPFAAADLNADDEPAVANTFADQRGNYDMSKTMNASTSAYAAGLAPDGGQYLYVDFDIFQTPHFKANFRKKKVGAYIMRSGTIGTIKFKHRRFVMRNIMDTTDGYIYPRQGYYLIKCRSWPLSSSLTSPGASNRPGGRVAFQVKKTILCRAVDNSVIQAPVMYYDVTNVGSTTDGKIFDDPETAPDLN